MYARVLRMVVAPLLATACGGTSASATPGSDASEEPLVADDATSNGDARGPDGTAGSSTPDDAALVVLPFVDASCAPPPLDGGPPSVTPVGDAGLSTIATLTDGGSFEYLVADDTTAYWTDFAGGSVMKAPLDGGPVQVLADVGTPQPDDIAVDDAYVFWESHQGQRILRCPKGASGCTPFVVLAPVAARGLALDARNVYTLDQTRVLACPKSGCRNAPTVIASMAGSLYGLVVDGVNAYFAYNPPQTGSTPQTATLILKCPLSGCGTAPSVLASDVFPFSLSTDGRYVYWISQVQADQPVTLKRCAVCGCGGVPEVVLANAPATSGALQSDGVHLFFSVRVPGQLMSCPVDGCASGPTVLLTGLTWALSVALGPSSVLVATQSSILSVPR